MGWILCKQGQYAQAKTYLEKASEHAPGQPATLYHLAWCEAKLGDTAAARAALQKALESKTKFMERDAAQKLLDSLPAGGNSSDLGQPPVGRTRLPIRPGGW